MESNPTEKKSLQTLVGSTIGDYDVIRRLGSGGMADVYLAEQKSVVGGEVVLRRNVALKILKAELSSDQSYVQRFHREAQAAAALVQSNIVQIYEVGEKDGVHFIAQEYVRGRNLKQYLNRFGAVHAVMAVNILRQVGMALQKAAEMNVIHRDIKPENIMLSTNGEVKVTDFGLARINDQTAKPDLTQIGITMGTPLYMSPEQVEGGEVDPRSDIYSLGITAYHMLVGTPPFEGDNALAIAVKHVKETPANLSQVRRDIPLELGELVHAMIAKKPEDRVQSASNLIRDIRKIQLDENEDWDEIAFRIAADENLNSSSEGRLAVTQQLQSVMHGQVKSWWASPLVIGALVLLMGCGAGLGYAVAKQKTVVDLLDVEVTDTTVLKKKETVREQYRQATWAYVAATDDEPDDLARAAESYMGVIDFHPIPVDAQSDSYYEVKRFHNLSRQQLGEVYWRMGDYEKAQVQFTALRNEPDKFIEFRVQGLIGQALFAERVLLNEFQVINAMQLLQENRIRTIYPVLTDFYRDAYDELRQKYSPNIGIGF